MYSQELLKMSYYCIFGSLKRLAVRTIFSESFALLRVGEILSTFKVRCLSRSRSKTVAAAVWGRAMRHGGKIVLSVNITSDEAALCKIIKLNS